MPKTLSDDPAFAAYAALEALDHFVPWEELRAFLENEHDVLDPEGALDELRESLLE